MASGLVEQFVWEKWCRVWYMGRIVEQQVASNGSPRTAGISVSSSSSNSATLVKVHIHGELETNDKWFPSDSANLVFVTVIPSELVAIGTFPALHDYVELLQMDVALYDLLRAAQSCGAVAADTTAQLHKEDEEVRSELPLLVGRVVQALPAHDASVVDILYPPVYHHVVHERRVHVGNGYLKVISELEFQARSRGLLRLNRFSSSPDALATQ